MRKRSKLVVGTLTLCFLVSGAMAIAAGPILGTIRVAAGLTRPLFVTHAPDDTDRIYIVEKPGRIKVMDLDTGDVSVFLDIRARVGGTGTLNSEQGLLGLAFHPDFANNKFFYVNYTNNSGDTRVSRFEATDPDNGDDASEFVILAISQPQSNHNGGWLAFGPNDGYLYIATGDGGAADDEAPGHTAGTGNAQDITNNLLGKMLRIDVDGGGPYAIPPDNPFVGITGDDEIWAYGLRNPWRSVFDPATGDLYIADVGQGDVEEVSYQRASSTGGENYGWRCREGDEDFNTLNCPPVGFVEPIHVYGHGGSPFRCSITGGEIYHGSEIPDLVGTYFFADWCSDTIWSFKVDGVGGFTDFENRTSELAPGGGLSVVNITSFGTDANGEMYICDHSTGNGEVFKIVEGLLPPVRALPPHDILKNRYISIDPRGALGGNPTAHHIRVNVVSSEVNGLQVPAAPWWATDPVPGNGLSPAVCISVLSPTKPAAEPDWSACPTVHLTGCPIIPTSTYAIAAESGGQLSADNLLGTQDKPGPKWHGDCVGFFNGAVWTPPNGTTNIDDAVAGIKTFQNPNALNATHLSVTDVHPNLDGTQINLLVSVADVFAIILGFQGQEYPGPDLTQCQ